MSLNDGLAGVLDCGARQSAWPLPVIAATVAGMSRDMHAYHSDAADREHRNSTFRTNLWQSTAFVRCLVQDISRSDRGCIHSHRKNAQTPYSKNMHRPTHRSKCTDSDLLPPTMVPQLVATGHRKILGLIHLVLIRPKQPLCLIH